MKKLASLIVLGLMASSLHAADTGYQPLRPLADCPRIDEINEWHVVDASHAILRTGPKRFLVTLRSACPRLGIGAPGLLFHANRSNMAVGEYRICGEPGESVRARYQAPCGIQSVRRIDAAEFKRLGKKATHHGSGADQPTKP